VLLPVPGAGRAAGVVVAARLDVIDAAAGRGAALVLKAKPSVEGAVPDRAVPALEGFKKLIGGGTRMQSIEDLLPILGAHCEERSIRPRVRPNR